MKNQYLLLFISLLIAPTAFTTPQLTINDLIHIALQNNADLKAARCNIALARANLVQAGLWPNPNLNLFNTDDSLLTNEGEYTRGAGFSQAFPVSGRIGQQKNVARVDVAIAIAEVRNAKRKLIEAVSDNYFALLITEYRLTQLDQLLTIYKKLVHVSNNRFLAAEVSEVDTNTAQLEYQRVLQDKQILASLRISQAAQLNQLLGRNINQPLLLNTNITPLIKKTFIRLTDALEEAIKRRPEMQMLWLSLHRAQANQQLARAERWADWTIGFAIQSNLAVIQGTPPQRPDHAVGIIVSIPLPLLNANQGKIMNAGIAGTQALAKIRALQLAIQTEVASNYNQLEVLRAGLQQSQMHTASLTVRNIQLASNAYKNGQLSLLEVLQIQRQKNDLQMAYLSMLEKYFQVLVKFCTSVDHYNSSCAYSPNKRNFDATL